MEAMSPWVFVYFILIVVIGGFFVINLFLAVIFEEILQAELNQEMQAAALRLAAKYTEQKDEVIGTPRFQARQAGTPATKRGCCATTPRPTFSD